MCTEALAFLHALFAGVQEGYLTFTAIHPDRNHPAPSLHVPVGNEAGLQAALHRLQTANAQGWGVYIGIATRKTDLGRWKRGGKGDVSALSALFVDLDGAAEAQRTHLAQFPILPSCVVSSGGGLHAYWLITPTRELATADSILHGLAQHFGADRMNISTSLRLPGTHNTKPARQGAPCRVMHLDPERRYTLADFAPWADFRPTRCNRWSRNAQSRRDIVRADAIQAIGDCLIRYYDGYMKPNGYLAALCPYGHARDHPGAHFNYDSRLGCAVCFGRHGRQSLADLRAVLRLDPRETVL